jgi:hypothetical protein
VCEGEAAHLGVGKGSPVSHEAEGKGSEGFDIARSGRRADLLASRRGILERGNDFHSLSCCAWPSIVFQTTHKSLTVTRMLIVNVPHVLCQTYRGP